MDAKRTDPPAPIGFPTSCDALPIGASFPCASPDRPPPLLSPLHRLGFVSSTVFGPQHFRDISLRLFSTADMQCIKQCLNEGAECGPDSG